jgi:tetratricopeptide (TPR) repeat protein
MRVSEARTMSKVLLAGCALVAATVSGCSRNRQEAILLANEGDKSVKVDPDGAIGKYEQATKLDPTNPHIFYKLAMAHKKKEEWDKVSEAMSNATKLAPEWGNFWLERGYALEQLAEKKTVSYEEAKEPYSKCIEIDPNYADCYHQLGNVYLWLDDEQKALEYWTKAIEHDPSQLRYYGPPAELYINLDYHKEAEQLLKEGKSFAKPGDPYLFGIHTLLSKIYQDRGQSAEMVAELEAAKSVAGDGPNAMIVQYSLGSTYAKLEPPRKQEAIQLLKGFHSRACKGTKAKDWVSECETAKSLVTEMGGSLQ